jgi:pyruvate, orthophosphate dikinase
VVNEGDWISVAGTHGTVMLGQVPVSEGETPPEFETILGWADEIRAGHLGVRANADNGADAAVARQHGAEGIGLCRTEHMFLGEDRLPVVQQMILASDPAEEERTLEALRETQRSDFVEILEAMDGLPVTIRLLDPPLHEFLPKTEDLAIKKATEGLTADEERLYQAALAWHEYNPMLGTRGVRLGVIKPGLYAMQVQALMEAALDRVAAGGHPIVEIMIPLTVSREELALARSWVEGAIAKAKAVATSPGPRSRASRSGAGTGSPEVLIGTMIETPRAALLAGEIAEVADFFSFGTNDLTQMTFGFSRDDVEGRMMSAYLEEGLLKRNPFEVVDPDGVGELVRLGVQRGRATNPSLKIGVCGEHGGDPESIATFAQAGLDYVSCSPFRVPIARLAAAQAVLAGFTSAKPGSKPTSASSAASKRRSTAKA